MPYLTFIIDQYTKIDKELKEQERELVRAFHIFQKSLPSVSKPLHIDKYFYDYNCIQFSTGGTVDRSVRDVKEFVTYLHTFLEEFAKELKEATKTKQDDLDEVYGLIHILQNKIDEINKPRA